jgi:hypothetical protein
MAPRPLRGSETEENDRDKKQFTEFEKAVDRTAEAPTNCVCEGANAYERYYAGGNNG